MKYTVLLDEFDEREIRPPELYEQYASLVAEELTRLLGAPATWRVSPCPACGSTTSAPAFRKNAFAFNRCAGCGSVFVSPRPPAPALATFAERSAGERFWRERVVAPTAASRGRYVSGPRIDWITDNRGALAAASPCYLHAGPAYDSIPEAMAERGLFRRIVAVSPPPAPARASALGLERVGGPLRDAVAAIREELHLVSVFETLEGEFAPAETLAAIRAKLAPGGRVLVSTVNCDGFEIRMLGERARGIGLPSHLNLFSLRGITRLCERSGLCVIELSTPGRLDAKLVADALRGDPALPLHPFVRDIVQHEEPAVQRHFQEFLQLARLSSHLRVVAEA